MNFAFFNVVILKAALVKEKATIQDRMVTVNDNMPNMDAPIQKPPVITKKGIPSSPFSSLFLKKKQQE